MKSRELSISEEQAVQWIVRTRDPAFDDWDAFTAWLEESPANARAYDALALADAEFADHLAAQPEKAEPAPAAQPTRRSALIFALAASVVGMIGYSALTTGPDPVTYQTAAGERRTLTLADGSRIDMNGSTRLIVEGERLARLERGEALFTVVHDEDDPFVVESRGARIVDVGTVFNVIRTDEALDLAVGEGEVIYNPDGEAVRLPAGTALHAADIANQVRVRETSRAAVGAWRQGRLVYDGATLELVAADLGRNLGMAVEVERGIAMRPFSGVIRLDGGGEPALRRAAAVLGLNPRRNERGWTLTTN